MRFQGQKASTALYLWCQTTAWSRRLVHAQIRFSAEGHAIYDAAGTALVAYEPRFETWFMGDQLVNGIRLEAPVPMLLWIRQGAWRCIGTYLSMHFDCAQQALCDAKGSALLFYFAARNCWAQIHPAFAKEEIQELCVTSQGQHPGM